MQSMLQLLHTKQRFREIQFIGCLFIAFAARSRNYREINGVSLCLSQIHRFERTPQTKDKCVKVLVMSIYEYDMKEYGSVHSDRSAIMQK